MGNSKNKRAVILGVVLVGLLIVAYKVVFVSNEAILESPEQVAAGEEVAMVLREIQGISFDTTILNDPKFRSLFSIETPLPTLPVGKKNPFAAGAN